MSVQAGTSFRKARNEKLLQLSEMLGRGRHLSLLWIRVFITFKRCEDFFNGVKFKIVNVAKINRPACSQLRV